MPITGFANTVRFCGGCGADLPRWVRLRLEELEDDKPALQEFGLEVVTRLCETLLRGGAPGLHFYTVNQAGPTLRFGRIWRCLCRLSNISTPGSCPSEFNLPCSTLEFPTLLSFAPQNQSWRRCR